jgi:hypothetical protein
MMYSLACAELRLGRLEQAGSALQASFESGFVGRDVQEAGRCLEDMQAEPRLREIIRLHTRE